MLSDISLFLHITFNNVCVKVVRCWPACARCAAWQSARTRSVRRPGPHTDRQNLQNRPGAASILKILLVSEWWAGINGLDVSSEARLTRWVLSSTLDMSSKHDTLSRGEWLFKG